MGTWTRPSGTGNSAKWARGPGRELGGTSGRPRLYAHPADIDRVNGLEDYVEGKVVGGETHEETGHRQDPVGLVEWRGKGRGCSRSSAPGLG